MGVEKTRQLSKPAKRDAPTSISRKNSRSQVRDVKAQLVATIKEDHCDIQRLELSSLFRKFKIGNLLLALKTLVGHGNFEAAFDGMFGGTLSLRHAQRYMHVARSIALAMPLFRARLSELREDLNHEELSEDQVLKELKDTELLRLIDQRRASTGKAIADAASRALSLLLVQCIEALFNHIDCVISVEPIEVNPKFVGESRVGTTPLTGLTEWPKTVLAISDSSKEGAKWIREILKAFTETSVTEALCIVPSQFLIELPQLFDFPELLLSPSDIFLQPKKGKATNRYLVVFLASPDRHQLFLSAFSALGTVKVPVRPRSVLST